MLKVDIQLGCDIDLRHLWLCYMRNFGAQKRWGLSIRDSASNRDFKVYRLRDFLLNMFDDITIYDALFCMTSLFRYEVIRWWGFPRREIPSFYFEIIHCWIRWQSIQHMKLTRWHASIHNVPILTVTATRGRGASWPWPLCTWVMLWVWRWIKDGSSCSPLSWRG